MPDPKLCTIQGCERKLMSRGWCSMHYYRWYRTGDTGEAAPRATVTWTPTGKNHHAWKGDEVSYQAAHRRLIRSRGKATEHRCVDCGAQAQEWSYRGDSPREQVGPNYAGDRVIECAYSSDPMDYDPRCIPCHRANDRHPNFMHVA